MNKNIILLLAVGAILILGAGGFFLYSKDAKPATLNQNAQDTNSTSSDPTGSVSSSSLLDIVATGGNQECTFSYKEGTESTEGTVYISGGNNLRGDFDITKDSKTTSINLIRNGDENYLWGDGINPGIKMTLSLKDLGGEQTGGYLDPNQKVDYECKNWTVDVSKFIPPSTVKFTDFSSFLPSPGVN